MNLFHHFFIPSERNNFRAKALHIDTLSFFLGLALFMSVSANMFFGGSVGHVLGVATDITIEKLYALTNQKRAEAGAPPLSYNNQLAAAAVAKANYMFTNNLWAHYGADGTTPWSFMLAAGYRYVFAGENLAKDFLFSQDVVDGWMNSPTHKENLLRADYKDVGFGVVNGTLNGQETTLVVQMFGSPQGAPLVAQAKAEEQVKVIPTRKPAIPTKTATTAPTKTATPTVVVTIPAAQIGSIKDKPLRQMPFSFFNSLNFTYLLIGFLSIALLFDFYFAWKLRLVRIVGKHTAHFIFLAFALATIVIITKGSIL